MPTRQSTRLSSPPPTQAAIAPKRERRNWLAILAAAVVFYAIALLVVYLLIVTWGLAQQRLAVSPQAGGAAGWPDVLGYPLTLAPAQHPLWMNTTVGVGLILLFVVCLALARRFSPAHGVVAQGSADGQPANGGPADEFSTVPSEWPTATKSAVADSDQIGDVADSQQTGRNTVGARPVSPARPAAPSTIIPLPVTSPLPVEEGPGVRSQRVFISHSSADNDFGLLLERRLKAELGEDAVFYDADGGLHAGDDWLTRLQHEIGACNVFVLILSPQAFASGWVAKELRYALRRAVSVSGMVIVPVLQQPTDVWPFLAEYQRVDFLPPGATDALSPQAKFEQGFADLLYAVRLGRSRIDELERMRRIRQGPPYDIDELPVPERFVGRAADVQWTLDHIAPDDSELPDGGLASIAAANGLGGIGKSALAGQVARILYATNRFPGGIAVVPCNGLSDPVTVLRRALSRFDPQRSEPDEVELRPLRDLARQVFATRRALVILDNVEADWPVEEVVQTLRTAGAAVLLTSRVRLPASAVPTEASRMLEILSPDEAIDLFAQYYGRGTKLDLTLSEQEQVGRIVRALGYHTLAVKLAAARAQGRDLAALAQEYADDPRLGVNLKDGTQAVRVMLDSSLGALAHMAPSAPRLFALLAAFVTSEMGRKAVLAVAESLELPDPRASLEALTDLRLADASPNLALPEEADRERLRLHPIVRTYAEEQFGSWDEDEREGAKAAVAVWYAGYANEAPYTAKATDEDNIVGALRWVHDYAGEIEADRVITRICNGMRNFWRDTGRTRAALEYLPWGIETAGRVANQTHSRDDRILLANIAAYYGDILQGTGQVEQAEHAYQEDLKARRDIGDRQGEGIALGRLGELSVGRGRLAQAQDYLERSLAIVQEVGDRAGEGVVLLDLGVTARARGQLSQAQDYLKRSLMIAQEVGNRRGEGQALNNLGLIARLQGQLAEAQEYYERSLTISREVGDRAGEGVMLNNLGMVAQYRGQLEQAQGYFERSLVIRQEVGDRAGEGTTLNNLGSLAQARGQLEQAQGYFERSLAIARETEYAELERVASGNLEAVVAEQRASGAS